MHAYAEIIDKNFQVMMRAIGFLQPSLQGEVDFVIIYDPAVPVSQHEARQMQTLLGDGTSLKGVTLRLNLVNASAIGAIPNGGIVFVTSGISYCHSKVAQSAKGDHVLTMSLDRSCVDSGDCILYVNTENRVEIVVNKSAAAAANVEFKQTFMMMVTTL